VDEAVDERDGAGGVWKDFGPLAEGLVGAEHDGLLGVVAARDDFEEEVGVAVAVREVADLVDAQKPGQDVAPQAAPERSGALLRGVVRRTNAILLK